MSKPGEYVGQDGRTYRWTRLDSDAGYSLESGEGLGIYRYPVPFAYSDWSAAKAALDELIETEKGEWVEVKNPMLQYRIRKDGSEAQVRDGYGRWRKELDSIDQLVHAAYRAGLSVGEAKGQERARELVAICNEITEKRHQGHRGEFWRDLLNEMEAAARKVQP